MKLSRKGNLQYTHQGKIFRIIVALLALVNALAFVHSRDMLDTNMSPVLESVYYDLQTVNSKYNVRQLSLETRTVWCDRNKDLVTSRNTGRPIKVRLCQTIDCPKRIAEAGFSTSLTVNVNSTSGNNLIGFWCKDKYERNSITLGDRYEQIWTFWLKPGTKNIYYLSFQPWDKKLWVHSDAGYVSFGLEHTVGDGRWIEFQFVKQ